MELDQWLPIVDYAVLKGISTSTLRRYIKANKIRYKIENGRYLIFNGPDPSTAPEYHEKPGELQKQLFQAQEQIAELKMLVAIYEEKLAQTNN